MRFQCQHCGGIIAVENDMIGQAVGCGHCENACEVPESLAAPGIVLNDFVLHDCIVDDGECSLHLAHQISMDQKIWLKILSPVKAQNMETVTEFVKEIRIRAADPNWQPRPRAVAEADGLYVQAYECHDVDHVEDIAFVMAKAGQNLAQFPGVTKVNDLEYWATLGNIPKVQECLQRGEDVNAKGAKGYTALHGAAENGHAEMVQLLLQYGANKDALYEDQHRPSYFARLSGHDAIADLLDA